MIRSMLTMTAAFVVCVLLVGCGGSDPEFTSRDKGPRPAPTTPQEAPSLPTGADTAQGGAPGGGRTGG